MLVDLERDAQRAVVDELQEGVLRLGVASEQVRRLGEHRFTDKQGRVEFLETFCNAAVVLFRPIEKGDQRPRINDGDGHCGRSPRDAWDSRPGQAHRNRRCRATAWSARHGSDHGVSCQTIRGRGATLPRPDRGACGPARPPPPWPDDRARRGPQPWSSSISPRADNHKAIFMAGAQSNSRTPKEWIEEATPRPNTKG